jgi:hypothetical protein
MCDIPHTVCGKHNTEKGDMKTRTIIIAIVAATGGALALWRFGTSTWGLLSAINLAIIIGVAGIYLSKTLDQMNDKANGFVVKDELSNLIEGKASKVAFKVGNYVWLALVWYEFSAENLFQLPTIGSPPVLLLGLLINLGIYGIATFYYRK